MFIYGTHISKVTAMRTRVVTNKCKVAIRPWQHIEKKLASISMSVTATDACPIGSRMSYKVSRSASGKVKIRKAGASIIRVRMPAVIIPFVQVQLQFIF